MDVLIGCYYFLKGNKLCEDLLNFFSDIGIEMDSLEEAIAQLDNNEIFSHLTVHK